MQRALIYMAAYAMVDFDHRGQRALPETGYGADREFLVGSGQQSLVGVATLVRILDPEAEFQANALQQIARTPRVAGGSTANADGVVALRLQIEQRVESDNAVDA